jgi:hypothetical protein
MGGICIYVHNSLDFEVINISELCTDKAMEACAIKCNFFSTIFCVLAIYMSLSGNFFYLLPNQKLLFKNFLNLIY